MSPRWKTTLAAAVMAAALPLTACSPGNSQAAADPASVRIGTDVPAATAAEMKSLYEAALAAREDSVVIYGPVGNDLKPVWDAFQQSFPGISVVARPSADAETTARINAEIASGKHEGDILHGGGSAVLQAAASGQCQPADIAGVEMVDQKKYVQADGQVVVPYLSGFGIMYNTSMVNAGEEPKTWKDMLDPKWKGKITMQDPRVVGISRTAFSRFQLPEASSEFGEAYLKQFAAQDPTFTSSGPQAAADVASGRYPVSMLVSQFFFLSQKSKGAPVAMTFPLASGNVLTATSSCLIKGAAHPNAARLLMDWMLTPEGQQALATKLSVYGVAKDAPAPEGSPALQDLKQLPDIPHATTEDYKPYFERLVVMFGSK